MQVDDKVQEYKLFNWLALNEKKLKFSNKWKSVLFFKKRLKGNMLAFTKGIDWRIEKNNHSINY